MGCDIHGPFVERQVSKDEEPPRWYPVAAFDFDRDYLLFGLLAGVRGSDEPVVEPRGYPADASWQWSAHHTYWDETKRQNVPDPDCHTPSWVTLPEAEEAQRRYRDENAWHPGGASRDLDYAIGLMRAVTEATAKPVRLGFCFDN